jgi:non-specific serine/threonine protein kinase
MVIAPLPDRPVTLPVSLTPLVGREREAETVFALLGRPDVRLVTLIGPGGVGKTRLALRVAAEFGDDLADGVAFVDLTPLTDPDLVLPAVATTLGLRESGDQPIGDQLAGFLAERQVLLVLDNVEQVTEAAVDLARLLAICPNLKLLVTSRVVLRLSAEHVFPVVPLPSTDAATLFVLRARATNPGIALSGPADPIVSQICARLDGLPLAIELAAARVRSLSPPALLAHLSDRLRLLTDGPRDAPPRLRTMRAAIAWSYDLLSPEEQIFFRHLAAFPGGFTLEGAQGALGALGAQDESASIRPRDLDARSSVPPAPPVPPVPPVPPDILDLVASLVDKSLVRQVRRTAGDANGQDRFAMLETVRAYGLERLVASGEEVTARQAHANFFTEFATRVDLWGAAQATWLSRLEADEDNVRAAITWWLEQGDVNRAQRLTGALWEFWYMRARLSEGRRWLDRALALGAATDPTAAAAALTGAGALAGRQGEFDRADALLAAGIAHYRKIGNYERLGVALGCRGNVLLASGDLSAAQRLYEEELAAYCTANHPPAIGAALLNLGRVAAALGEIERARSLLAEARAIAQASGGNWDLALIDLYLGRLAHGRGDLECAHRHYLETLLLIRDPLDPTLVARSLEGLAGIAAAWGTPARGARLLGAAETLRAEAGQPMISEDFPTFDDARAAGRRLLAKEVYEEAVATGRTLAIDSAIAEALAIEPPAAVVAPPDPLAGFGLTRREREVLTLLADGHSTNEIAAALFISPKTAGVHAANLLRKLGVPSRAAAVAFAHRHGLAAAVPRPARPEAD